MTFSEVIIIFKMVAFHLQLFNQSGQAKLRIRNFYLLNVKYSAIYLSETKTDLLLFIIISRKLLCELDSRFTASDLVMRIRPRVIRMFVSGRQSICF